MTDSRAEKILHELRKEGLYRSLRPSCVSGARAVCDGESFVNFASNDYLGISADSALQREFFESLPNSSGFLMGAVSSRLLGGDNPAFSAFEKLASAAYSAECSAPKDVLYFNCGYHANAGILPTIAEKGDLVLYDKLSHASLIDSIAALPCKWARFPHNNMQRLREILLRERAAYKNVYIITESVFSMDGDRADLRALVEIKREFDCSIYVDEAHAVGVFGATGLGLCQECGLIGEVDYIMCTLGKALASQGAYAVCSPAQKKLLINRCRTFIFTTAVAPINVMWSDFVFRRLCEMGDRRKRLSLLAADLRGKLKCFETLGDTQIVPVVVGANSIATDAAEAARRAGIWTPAVRYPTVPKNSARLRLSVNAALSDADIALAAETLNLFAKGQNET